MPAIIAHRRDVSSSSLAADMDMGAVIIAVVKSILLSI